MSIKESALTAITSITQSDFIRAVTSAGASRRVTVANLAKAIVESYTGSSLAGANQSVKSALDSLNSKTSYTLTAGPSTTINTDISRDQKNNKIRVLKLRVTTNAALVNTGVIASTSQPFAVDFQYPAIGSDGNIYRVRCSDTTVKATGNIPSGITLFLSMTDLY